MVHVAHLTRIGGVVAVSTGVEVVDPRLIGRGVHVVSIGNRNGGASGGANGGVGGR